MEEERQYSLRLLSSCSRLVPRLYCHAMGSRAWERGYNSCSAWLWPSLPTSLAESQVFCGLRVLAVSGVHQLVFGVVVDELLDYVPAFWLVEEKVVDGR